MADNARPAEEVFEIGVNAALAHPGDVIDHVRSERHAGSIASGRVYLASSGMELIDLDVRPTTVLLPCSSTLFLTLSPTPYAAK